MPNYDHVINGAMREAESYVLRSISLILNGSPMTPSAESRICGHVLKDLHRVGNTIGAQPSLRLYADHATIQWHAGGNPSPVLTQEVRY